MTIRDALAELEDRDLPDVIALIRWMDREIDELRTELDNLRAKVREDEYRGF